ncbi:MAG TPA: hypothetical protein VIX37_06415 [Candidatus Sulfotelmatobacter sp.]
MAAAIMSNFSYPKMPGDQPWSVVDVTGPASYVQIAPGPIGGQQITAGDCGVESIDWAQATGASGTPLGYSVNVIPAQFAVGSPTSAVLLQWVNLNLTEATQGQNLSTLTVRLLVIGH